MKIYSLSGQAQAGKDTVSDIIIDLYAERGQKGYKAYFASDLKRMAFTYYNWNGVKDKEGRMLLQHLGSDVVRSFEPSMWLAKFCNKFSQPLNVPDCIISKDVLTKMIDVHDKSTAKNLMDRIRYLLDDEKVTTISTPIEKAIVIGVLELGYDLFPEDRANQLIHGLIELFNYKNTTRYSTWHLESVVSEFVRCRNLDKIKLDADVVCVPDVRFPNELELLKHLGAESIFVKRPALGEPLYHISERALAGCTFDHSVLNDQDPFKPALTNKIKAIIRS